MSHLPAPEKPYPDWSRLVDALWKHGIETLTAEDEGRYLEALCQRARGSLVRDEAQQRAYVRPSNGLVCPRIAWYLRQGLQPEAMPGTIGPVFLMGHMAHELAYAAFRNACPPGFVIHTELATKLDWPEDCAQEGTADVIFEIVDRDLANAYLPPGEPACILGDIKTMVGFAWREHRKKPFAPGLFDAWGHLKQLAAYASAKDLNVRFPGLQDAGALLIAANKESPQMGIATRLINPLLLQEITYENWRLLDGTGKSTPDPGPVALKRYGPEAVFFCGDGTRSGYCPFKAHCGANR